MDPLSRYGRSSPSYQVFVTETLTGVVVSAIVPSSLSWSKDLNDVGSAQITCKAPSGIVPNRNSLVIVRNDTIVWSGIVVTTGDDWASDTETIRAAGYLMWLDRRNIRHELDLSTQDVLHIPFSLVGYAQDTSLHPSNANIGISTAGRPTLGVVHVEDVFYEPWERKSIGQEIRQLSSLDYDDNGTWVGFDFDIDSGWDGESEIKKLNVWHPWRGHNNANPALITKGHCSAVKLENDGAYQALGVLVRGTGGADDAYEAELIADSAVWPFTEEVVSYKTLDVETQIAALARREQRNRAIPLVQPQVSLWDAAVLEDPTLSVGSQVQLALDHDTPGRSHNDLYRIMSIDASYSGGEAVRIQLVKRSMFP